MWTKLISLVFAAGLFPGVAAAGPQVPPAEARLVVGGPAADGGYDVGIAISLPEGWHTYWRNPGDSGMPPSFDTTGSANLSAFAVSYPAPTRYFDGYGTSIVYDDGVLLPARVTAADAAKPVRLTVKFDYGYCKEICVPAQAAFDVELAPSDAGSPADAAAIAEARERVPVPAATAGPAAPRLVALEPGEADGARHVDLTVKTAGGSDGVDLFVEGPEGWYLSPPAVVSRAGDRAVFRLALDGMPKAARLAGTPLRFTIVDGDEAVEDVRSAE